MELTNKQAADLGRAIVDMYQLKPMKNSNARKGDLVMYDTDFGPKAVEGLGRCLVHVLAKNGYVMQAADKVATTEDTHCD